MQRHQRVRYRGQEGTVTRTEGPVVHVKLDSGEEAEVFPGEAIEPISRGTLRLEWIGPVAVLKGRKVAFEKNKEVGMFPFSLRLDRIIVMGCYGDEQGRGVLDFQVNGLDYELVADCTYEDMDDAMSDFLLTMYNAVVAAESDEFDDEEGYEDEA